MSDPRTVISPDTPDTPDNTASAARAGSRGAKALASWAPRLALVLAPLLLVLPQVLGWSRAGFIDRVETYLYDLRVRLTMPGGIDRRIVIVDIDEASIALEGRWPWPRSRLATLVDRLFDDYAVRVVGFDVQFPEPEESSARRLLDALAQQPFGNPQLKGWIETQRPRYLSDDRFAESLIARDVVLGFAFKPALARGEPVGAGQLPSPYQVQGAKLDDVPWTTALGYTGNLPALQANARAAGFFDTPLVDDDGVVRRMPLLQRYDGRLYESLGLAVARVVREGAPLRFGFRGKAASASRLDYVELGESRVPVDESGAILAPFRGGVGSFPYVPASAVLRGTAPAEQLRDAIVLVGTSAIGLLDIRATPVAKQYFGVETHANVIAGILDGAIRASPPQARMLELAVLGALALLLLLLVPRLRPATAFIAVAAAATAVVAWNLFAWQMLGWSLSLAPSLLYLLLTSVLLLNYGYFVESRRKRRLSRIFGQYVPPDIVRDLDAGDAEASLQGESREMSVLFSDVRGFTTLSEGLSPRDLTRMMNEFLTPITAAIQERRGTIDKYMGDAVMAFWGAPLSDAAHAHHAVLAALAMVERVAEVRRVFEQRGWPPLHIGIGVSTGLMNVGNMGSQFRMAYTVLGDTVNLGSRLEGLTKQYGVQILVSEATARAAAGFLWREVDRVRVKGKTESVAIFEPVCARDGATPALIARVERFHEALTRYRRREFDSAGALLDVLEAEAPDKLFGVYLARIAMFRDNPPPPDWDGVFVHESK